MNSRKVSRILMVVVFVALACAVPVLAQGEQPPVEPPVFDMTFISQLLQSLVLATVPVLAGFAARWLNAKYQFERSQLTEKQQVLLDGAIKVAVFAAEQMGLTDQIADKKEYAIGFVTEWLAAQNFTIDFREIDARIEAAVKENLNF